jgi:hypothetical protein
VPERSEGVLIFIGAALVLSAKNATPTDRIFLGLVHRHSCGIRVRVITSS